MKKKGAELDYVMTTRHYIDIRMGTCVCPTVTQDDRSMTAFGEEEEEELRRPLPFSWRD